MNEVLKVNSKILKHFFKVIYANSMKLAQTVMTVHLASDKRVATYMANMQVHNEILSKLTKFRNAPSYLHDKILLIRQISIRMPNC